MSKFVERNTSAQIAKMYPNHVVFTEYGTIDYEETVFNISYDVAYKMGKTTQSKLFGGEVFEDQESAYDFIIGHLNSLHEQLIELYERG